MSDNLTQLTAAIVAGYVEGNKIAGSDLPQLISATYEALKVIQSPAPGDQLEPTAPKLTAAQIRKSIQPDALISFLDRKPYRMLKRHLATHGMTPQEYRSRFNLPKDYPMTAPSYSAQRSQLAKSLGLGQMVAGTKRRSKAKA